MNFTPTKFLTETGRMLWGDLYNPTKTDFDGNPLKPLDSGQPHPGFIEFGLAIPKKPGETHFAHSELGKIIWAQGHKDHPNAAAHDSFSWKVTDGDSTKPGKPYKGKPGRAPCEKEGYPGHWVFSFRCMAAPYPPRLVNSDGSKNLLEPGLIQPGDCIQVAGSVVGNDGATPGVYLNPDAIAFQGYHVKGRVSTGGIDPTSVGFGKSPKPTFVTDMAPAGLTPVGAGGPPTSTGPANSAVPPPASAPSPSSPPPPPTAVTPAPSFIAPPPANTGVAPPPAGPRMTATAKGTYAQYIAAGWNDAQLRAAGFME